MARAGSASRLFDPAEILLRPLPVPIAGIVFLLVGILAVLVHTEPILDGDLFWHLAYARQMLEQGTPIPDHALYSWTPTNNAAIYCAWLAEFVLYGVWSAFGLGGIFVLRYLIVAAVLLLIWRFARMRGVASAPVTALVLLIVAWLSHAGSLPKPEMFTLFFFTASVSAYAFARAVPAGTGAWRIFFAVPLIVLVWANSHGGFLMIAPFLAATAIAEMALYLRGATGRLERRALLHLLAAWALCAVAINLTPYGIAYPVALLREYVLGTTARPDVVWNAAYVSILHPDASGKGYLTLLILILPATFLLADLASRRDRGALLRWLPLALAALCYLPFYVAMLRTTQFLPIVLAFVVLGIAGEATDAKPEKPRRRSRLMQPALGAGLAACIALFGMFHLWLNPPWRGWIGFGIGDVNPVQEAEFLARQDLDRDIYNIFDSGGYLLWRLYPHHRVMTDSRSFPYLSWFEDQYAFTIGEDFERFQAKYPADIAVIDLAKKDLWRKFLGPTEWRMVYYGPTAAIFVKQAKLASVTQSQQDSDPARFAKLKSVGAALDLFEFATFIGDYAAANAILAILETRLHWQMPAGELARARHYRDAIRAVRSQDYARGLEHLEYGLYGRQVADRDRVLLTILVALVRTTGVDPARRTEMVAAIKQLVPTGF